MALTIGFSWGVFSGLVILRYLICLSHLELAWHPAETWGLTGPKLLHFPRAYTYLNVDVQLNVSLSQDTPGVIPFGSSHPAFLELFFVSNFFFCVFFFNWRSGHVHQNNKDVRLHG